MVLQFIGTHTLAQKPSQPAFQHFTTENNLAANQIYSLYQDSQGFIWIATNQGVSRFDGNQFINYTPENGLETYNVFLITGDANGRVFFYCNNQKISVWENGRFSTLSIKPAVIKRFGSLFVAGNKGLCINNDFSQVFASFRDLKMDTTAVIQKDYHQGLMPRINADFKTGSTLIYGRDRNYDLTETQMFEIRKALYSHNFQPKDLASKPFRIEIFRDSVFLLTHSRITIFKLGKHDIKKTREIELPPFVINVELLSNGSIGVSTQKNGTLLINAAGIRTFAPAPFTSCSLIDREGNLWIGTVKDGLYMAVKSDITVLDKRTGLASDEVLSVVPFNGHLWLGHDFGRLSIIDSKGIKNTSLSGQSDAGITQFNYLHLMKADSGKLLLRTNDGLVQVSQRDAPVTLGKHFPLNALQDLLIKKDSIYYLTNDGLTVSSSGFSEKLIPEKQAGQKLLHIAQEGDGGILIGTSDGVFKAGLNLSQKKLRLNSLYPQLDLNIITGIAVSKNHTAIASNTRGVLLKNIAGKYRLLNTPTIASPLAVKVVFENDSTLLVCTNKGLNRIRFSEELQIKKTEHFTTSAGLPSDFVNDIALYKNTYYIATSKGLAIAPASLNPRHEQAWMAPPTDTAEMPYHSTDKINISFPGFSYRSLGKLTFKYKLSGLDTGWNFTTENHKTYDNLSPGRYRFMAKVIDRFGNESSNLFTMPIYVRPFWYQSTYFKVLTFCLALFIIYAFVRQHYRIKLKVQKAEFVKLLAIQEERQRISSEIHDDIGAGLAGIRLMTELLSHKTQDSPVGSEVKYIHLSLRELSEKMGEVVWSLNGDNDTLENLIFFLQNESIRFFGNSTIHLHFSIEGEIPLLEIKGDHRRQIYLVVKELLHNCLKHSKGDQCLVTVSFSPSKFILLISDNGVGFDVKSVSMFGNGIRNINKRMKSIKGRMQWSMDNGTAVRVEIPLNKNL